MSSAETEPIWLEIMHARSAQWLQRIRCYILETFNKKRMANQRINPILDNRDAMGQGPTGARTDADTDGMLYIHLNRGKDSITQATHAADLARIGQKGYEDPSRRPESVLRFPNIWNITSRTDLMLKNTDQGFHSPLIVFTCLLHSLGSIEKYRSNAAFQRKQERAWEKQRRTADTRQCQQQEEEYPEEGYDEVYEEEYILALNDLRHLGEHTNWEVFRQEEKHIDREYHQVTNNLLRRQRLCQRSKNSTFGRRDQDTQDHLRLVRLAEHGSLQSLFVVTAESVPKPDISGLWCGSLYRQGPYYEQRPNGIRDTRNGWARETGSAKMKLAMAIRHADIHLSGEQPKNVAKSTLNDHAFA